MEIMEKIIKIQALVRGFLVRKKLFIISCKSVSNFLVLNNEISPTVNVLQYFVQSNCLFFFKKYGKSSDLKSTISNLQSLISLRKQQL